MIELIALMLVYAGFVALALAMNRHHRQVWNRAASKRTQILLRAVGTASLASALAACIIHAGWSIGLVLWFGMLSAAGIVLVLLLAFRPHAIAGTGLVRTLRPNALRRLRTLSDQ